MKTFPVKISPHLARFRAGLQPLSWFFLLALCGCATAPGPHPTRNLIPDGYYIFDAPGIYEAGMARVSQVPRGAKVQLLETFEGSFELHPRGDRLRIRNDEVSYPTLRRSLSGDGELIGPGQVRGNAEIWVATIGAFSRDHRKSEWTLRPATPEEIERHENRQRRLEERKRRAGMLPGE